MAVATYANMFETVSGALNKINKKSPHAKDQKMVLTTHRVAPTTSPDCSRVYVRGIHSVTRTTPPTSRELGIRSKFSAVAAAVAARQKDVSKITADQAAFIAQKDTPNGKKTMRSYLWALEAEAYEAQG